jgi:glycosyltransferase involved in cell wall biosynthesis
MLMPNLTSTNAMVDRSNQSPAGGAMRIVVGIATRGRAAILNETLSELLRQRRAADEIIVAYAEDVDVDDAPQKFPVVRFLHSPLGLTRQRNAILDACLDSDIVMFIDDDFYLDTEYLGIIERLFVEHSEVAAATGSLVANGINGPGISGEEAKSLLRRINAVGQNYEITETFNTYGCNMSFRLAPIREHEIRFDELLALYGWAEDVDFSRQLARYGLIVKVSSAYGVHLGSKVGRTSGLRFGYSQIANPIYMARKGTLSWRLALISMTCLSGKNILKSLWPEPYVDRLGRVRGNLVAFADLLRGELCPSKITRL